MIYGCVFLSTGTSTLLKDTDIRLENIGKNQTFPDSFIVHIETKQKQFRCIIDVNKKKQVQFFSNVKFIGYKCFNVPGKCDVNTTVGSVIMDLYYEFEGKSILKENYIMNLLNLI